MGKGITVAVLTGGHPYDVIRFHELWSSFREIVPYIQHMEDFTTSEESTRDSYDVIVFYHMIMPAPAEQVAAVLQRATERGQGLVILHHALLAYPDWPFWTGLVGIKDRAFGYHHGQKIRVNVPEARHPVTASMQSWNMTDETYTMQEPDLAPASDILLTLDHEKSMNAIAWTRTIGSSRVFCYQGGHDAQTWTHESFRKVLLRGTLWCARRI